MKLWLILSLLTAVMAADPKKTKTRKEINFEGEVVEGVGRQPLDSLSQIAERDSGMHRSHLYQKRQDLRDRNLEKIEEIAETY